MKFDYSGLSLTDLIEKIKISNFFNLPRMVAEAFKKVQSLISANEPSYKVYTALLTQSGTDAPVATVLENTLGDIVWSYYDIGQYKATLAGQLNINKRIIFVQPTNEADGTTTGYVTFSDEDQSNDSFIIKCVDVTGTPVNEIVVPRGIEIRVYN